MDQKLLRILGGDTHHYPYALERKYPRILTAIMDLWDSPNMESYLEKLLIDERGDRAGFPPEVASEIVHLSLVHASQHRKQSHDDVWSPEARLFSSFDPLATAQQAVVWPHIESDITFAIQSMGIACTPDGFFRALAKGHIAAVKLFLEAGVSVETSNEDGWTTLMLAAYHNQEELATLLIQKGADVFAQESGGNTALHWAAFAGHLACCKLLVNHKAVVDARSNFGWTPLYQAIARNHLVVAMFLIAHGADVNASAKDGQTPLHKAAATGELEIIKLLISHHADTQRVNHLGNTPLMLAIKNNQDEAATLLKSAD